MAPIVDMGAYEYSPPVEHRTILSWASVRTHGASAVPIALIAAEATTEPRGGIRQIEASLDAPATSVNPAGVTVTAGGSSYTPESVTLSGGNQTLILTFADTPGDHYLPDGQSYTIALATDTVSPPLAGPATVTVRSLAGESTNNGALNLGDVLYVKSKIGQPVDPTTAVVDIDLSGAIDMSDVLAAKAGI